MPECYTRHIRKFFTISWLLFLASTIFSQDKLSEIRKLIETIAEEQALAGEVADIELLATDLEYFYNNPINLNAAGYEELTRLWVLNDFQIHSLIDYRKKMGALFSLSEIQYVYGFDQKTVELISPFVYVGSKEKADTLSLKSIAGNTSFEYLLRSGWRSYDAEMYNGKTFNCYTRLTGNLDEKINLAVLAEHDAGESFSFGPSEYGFDFYSGYLQFSGNGVVRQLTVGDYRVKAGQGLLLMNGYTMGKSSEISSAKIRSQAISGNTSKDEYNFMRGISTTVSVGKFAISLFGSSQHRDANIDTINDKALISSLYSTGYHRTASELANQNSLQENTAGTIIRYNGNRLGLGLNLLGSAFSLPFAEPNEAYRKKAFTGSKYQGASFDYSLLLQKFQLFGELASANNAPAIFTGLCLMPASQVILTLSHRYYDAGYFSPYANGFSESGKINNEQGLYAGLKWTAPAGLVFTAYADQYSYPGFSYGADGVLRGKEYMAGLEWNILPEFELSLRYRIDTKDKNTDISGQATHILEPKERQNFRFQVRYRPSETTTFTTRFEKCASGFENSESQGYLLFQDIQWQPGRLYSFTFRYAVFNAEAYDSRIYAYEHDVLYAYTVPAYYGNGQRVYLLFRYRINPSVTFWLRAEHTNYFGREMNSRNGLRGQVIVRF